MFIDDVVIKVVAGNGGDGCTAFRREKFVPMGGPFGGNGGRGSNIVFEVDEGLHTLLDLRYQKTIKGQKGENGRGKNQNGKGAEDVVIKVPQGTVVTDMDTGLIIADLKEKTIPSSLRMVVVAVVVIQRLRRKVIRLRIFRNMVNRAKKKCCTLN